MSQVIKIVQLEEKIPDYVFSSSKWRALRAELDSKTVDEWATFVVPKSSDEDKDLRLAHNVRSNCYNYLYAAKLDETYRLETRVFRLDNVLPPDITEILMDQGAADGDLVVQAKRVEK